jgi:methylenetetrahydrofolate dehydrogenase (NADP+)/methenyltetrahydrofolate cyclohydrolase
MLGKPVADEMAASLAASAERLAASGVSPRLAVVRVGDRPDDVAYEDSIARRAKSVGVELKRTVLGPDADTSLLREAVRSLASDENVHGILVFRPLPQSVGGDAALADIPLGKDVDGVTAAQMAALYTLKKGTAHPDVFFPCTAEAVMRVLDHYGISAVGKHAVVIGRSSVIGKPVAHLLLARGATVTICHSETTSLVEQTRGADILVCAAGLAAKNRALRLGAEYFSPGQTVVDVAINADDEGLYGDADTDAAQGVAANITPVPGGLGAVTAFVLMEHVIRATEAAMETERNR